MASLWRRSSAPPQGERGERGHFSFEKRSVPPRPPKRNPGGFRFPPGPLETTQRGGAAAPPLWIPLPGFRTGSAERSGERGANGKALTMTTTKDAARCQMRAAPIPVPQGYSAPGGNQSSFCRIDSHDPRTQAKKAQSAVLRKTFFLFHRARRIFFLMFQKENGGASPPGEAGPSPVPRRGAKTPSRARGAKGPVSAPWAENKRGKSPPYYLCASSYSRRVPSVIRDSLCSRSFTISHMHMGRWSRWPR